jgi:hypothetical protein
LAKAAAWFARETGSAPRKSSQATVPSPKSKGENIMLMVGVLIAFISGGADARPLPTPIADCDGSGATYFSSTHSANEDWFSLTGRVVG